MALDGKNLTVTDHPHTTCLVLAMDPILTGDGELLADKSHPDLARWIRKVAGI